MILVAFFSKDSSTGGMQSAKGALLISTNLCLPLSGALRELCSIFWLLWKLTVVASESCTVARVIYVITVKLQTVYDSID